MPSIASIVASSSANVRLGALGQVAPVGVDVLTEQRDLPDASAATRSTSATISAAGRDTSRPRVDGTMQ